MNANRENIRKDNRKNAIRFAAIMLLCMAAGAVVGYCSSSVMPEDVRAVLDAGAAALTLNAPGLLVGTAVLGMAVCLALTLRARAALRRWDGEDERAANAIENRLNWLICASNLMMILGLLLFSVGALAMDRLATAASIIGTLVFFATLIGAVLFQQQVVDMNRVLNPEKSVSLYDPKFQKKFFTLCDERERLQVGQACYTAFRAFSILCPVMWLVLMIVNLISDGWLGVAPTIVVTVLWGAVLTVYVVATIRMEKMK